MESYIFNSHNLTLLIETLTVWSFFQALLKEARKEIDEKDREILRLTKEVVELRLYKASLNSPDERTDSSDALTVRENNPFSPESPSKDLPDEAVGDKVASPDTPEKRVNTDLPPSLSDSGHFEDGSVHSKESMCLPEAQPEIATGVSTIVTTVSDDTVTGAISAPPSTSSADRDEERRVLVSHYENRIEDMHRRHVDELQELKQKHNDKVRVRSLALVSYTDARYRVYRHARPSGLNDNTVVSVANASLAGGELAESIVRGQHPLLRGATGHGYRGGPGARIRSGTGGCEN